MCHIFISSFLVSLILLPSIFSFFCSLLLLGDGKGEGKDKHEGEGEGKGEGKGVDACQFLDCAVVAFHAPGEQNLCRVTVVVAMKRKERGNVETHVDMQLHRHAHT